jgi:hypothetical protein
MVIRTNHPEYHPEALLLSVSKGKAARHAYAVAQLRELLGAGDTVYTVLRHVSRSGMSRRIDCYKMTAEGPRYLSSYVADVLGYPEPKDGIRVDGCGMDMGYHLVNSLSTALFCPNGYTHEGAYALKHAWI